MHVHFLIHTHLYTRVPAYVSMPACNGELCACAPVDKYVFVNTFAYGVGEYTCLYLHVCDCVQTRFPASKAQMNVADLPRRSQAWGLRSKWSCVSGIMGRWGWSRAECPTR